MTTSHLDPTDTEQGGALLPIFTVALLVAIVPIILVGLAPSVGTLALALGTIIAFTGGIIALLGRLIGPEEH